MAVLVREKTGTVDEDSTEEEGGHRSNGSLRGEGEV
jgi:hypothetical protein